MKFFITLVSLLILSIASTICFGQSPSQPVALEYLGSFNDSSSQLMVNTPDGNGVPWGNCYDPTTFDRITGNVKFRITYPEFNNEPVPAEAFNNDKWIFEFESSVPLDAAPCGLHNGGDYVFWLGAHDDFWNKHGDGIFEVNVPLKMGGSCTYDLL